MSTLRKEIFRKLFHLTELLIIVGYGVLRVRYSHQIGILGLTALLLLLLEIEYFRIDYQTHLTNQINDFFSKFILRKHERNNVTGAIFFVISTIICFSVFDYPIALLALLLTVFGDFAAALMGIAFGRKKVFRNKSYVGSLSSLIINIIIGFIFLPSAPEIVLPMAFVASFVETITQKLDDNLTVPLFAGFVGQLIVFFFK